MPTFLVHFGITPDSGKRETYRYSKLAPLVITRAVDDVGTGELPYVITHAASGLLLTRVHKLAVARQALKALLPLTDWTQGRLALEHDIILLRRAREVVAPFNLIITSKR